MTKSDDALQGGPTYLDKRDPIVYSVRLLIDGFRKAAKEVYGVDWKAFFALRDQSLRNSPHFGGTGKGLCHAVKMMLDHDVPPFEWCMWQLTFYKTKLFPDKPPPWKMVLSGNVVEKRAGWFRKAYQMPTRPLVTRVSSLVQLYRNMEARRRVAGFVGAGVWMVLPRWYRAMRLGEIDQGFVNPHDLWTEGELSPSKALFPDQ